MKIVYLTAGAAGMYCGSCMHDNALAKAMRRRGDDVILQPIYTPIRVDEESIAQEQVFFGGIHVYLLQRLPLLRLLPRFMRSWLDSPRLIRRLTRKAVKTDPTQLGAMTVSMLRGQDGRQADEVNRFVDWLESEMQPDAIIFSNLLIGGAIPLIRERLPHTKLIVVFQGDDIFLDHLPADYQAEAIGLLSELSWDVDQFVTHSEFYRDKMAALLGIDEAKFVTHPLSIDLEPFRKNAISRSGTRQDFRIGFVARIAPEKGLHVLVDAFIHLANEINEATLHVAGWLGEHNQAYLDELRNRLEVAGFGDRFVYHGSPSLEEKIQLMRTMDVLCVPTTYEDPKGLFALEALAARVPIILPNHGAFPELIESTQGGVLFSPADSNEAAESMRTLFHDSALRERLANRGHHRVHESHSIERSADLMRELIISDRQDAIDAS